MAAETVVVIGVTGVDAGVDAEVVVVVVVVPVVAAAAMVAVVAVAAADLVADPVVVHVQPLQRFWDESKVEPLEIVR